MVRPRMGCGCALTATASIPPRTWLDISGDAQFWLRVQFREVILIFYSCSFFLLISRVLLTGLAVVLREEVRRLRACHSPSFQRPPSADAAVHDSGVSPLWEEGILYGRGPRRC